MITEQQVDKWVGKFRSFPAICPRCNTKFLIRQQLLNGVIRQYGNHRCPTCGWCGPFRFPFFFKSVWALKLKAISDITRLNWR